MIISDATIIITLINIDRFDILKLFVNKIYITQEVYNEVTHRAYAKTILDRYIKDCFVEIKEFSNKQIYKEFRYILDDGEASSITLALEMDLPLIIDEKKGRKFAQSQGVEIIGLIGILRFLYIEKRVDKNQIKDIIVRLNDTNFRISNDLIDMILA
jgi:predicted nucleic acid-binding protein